jgi:hypothetical protein
LIIENELFAILWLKIMKNFTPLLFAQVMIADYCHRKRQETQRKFRTIDIYS